jgi:hydrogenase/urease accessory protein HupE
MKTHDDATLSEAVARRNEEAFPELYDRFLRPIFSFIVRMLLRSTRRLWRFGGPLKERAKGGQQGRTMVTTARPRRKITRRLAILIGVVFAWSNAACAHDPGISTAQGELRTDALVLTTGFAPADIQQLLPVAERSDETWTQTEFDTAHEGLLAIAPGLWEVRAGDAPIPPRDLRVQLLPGDNVSFHLVFPLPVARSEKLILRASRLTELPSSHRQFVIISDERGFVVTKKLLSARDTVIEIPLSRGAIAGKTPAPTLVASDADSLTFWGFLRLGVEHIWTGYDHLLFLFALLIVCRTFRSIVAIVSCFTLAHSVTLALATLDVVNLPARFVEPAIAASIVFVGVENLWRRGEEPRGRWALTFVFGLIHGFGFASVLRDLGVGQGREGVALPLFTFNLGVELGQVAVAAVVLPLIWWLRKSEVFVKRGVPVLSALVALAGVYWLLERTVLR